MKRARPANRGAAAGRLRSTVDTTEGPSGGSHAFFALRSHIIPVIGRITGMNR